MGRGEAELWTSAREKLMLQGRGSSVPVPCGPLLSRDRLATAFSPPLAFTGGCGCALEVRVVAQHSFSLCSEAQPLA